MHNRSQITNLSSSPHPKKSSQKTERHNMGALVSCEMDRIRLNRPRWLVKEWREHRSLTQEQLADRSEMTKSMISEIENGKKRLHDDHIAALCFALGIETEDLLRHPKAPTPTDLLRTATPEQEKQIMDFAAFVLGKRAS